MIDQLIDAIGDMAQAAAARLAAIAVIGLVMLVGSGFVLAGIYMALAAQVGPVVSALTIGIVLIVLGLAVAAIWFGKSPTFSQDKPGQTPKAGRTEEDVIIDLLMDAARAGFATGQGDKKAMNQGLERVLQDLHGLGTFERQRAAEVAVAQAEAAHAAASERAAHDARDAAEDLVGPETEPFPRDPGMMQK